MVTVEVDGRLAAQIDDYLASKNPSLKYKQTDLVREALIAFFETQQLAAAQRS